jgi:RNA ligase (TIGR02306 family)
MSSLIVEVCEVKEIRKHPDADKLEIAVVKDWECLVGVGDHEVGELVIFVPPDSILPPDLIEKWNIGYLKNKKTGRVGVIKLRGVYSYGLIVPNYDGYKKGTNVADIYGITKWVPPSERVGKSRKKANPRFHKYTDIENYRNFEDVLVDGEQVIISEKIHGTNLRAGWVLKDPDGIIERVRNFLGMKPAYEFVVGSRNVQLKSEDRTYYGTNIYQATANYYELKDRIPRGYVVYGEIFGFKIQDLIYGRTGLDVRFFDVMHEGEYLNLIDAYTLLVDWGLKPAPLWGNYYWSKDLVEDILETFFSKPSKLDESTLQEGVVIRPVAERTDPKLGRVILKLVNPEYLARKGGSENK